MPISDAEDGNCERWLDHFMPRAEAGDPGAQIAVGWQYFTGECLERDTSMALMWFRRAEKTVGDLAVLHILWMFSIEDDPRIEAVFRERDEWHLGAIYVLYGDHLWRADGNAKNALPFFRIGGFKGSLAGWLKYRKLRYPGLGFRLLFLPYELPKIIRMACIRVGDPYDVRVLGYSLERKR